jgi:hypothetical protein
MVSNPMIKLFKYLFLVGLLVLVFPGNQLSSRNRHSIEVVFCLDLSGSTNGLLDDVRERIWEVVNQVNSYRPAPEFRIGIVGFSRPSFGAKNGYVKVLQQLTTDYDLLTHELYKLKPSIEKGDQLVGHALKVSIRNMNWSEDKNNLKIIYLVGNGMVNMGGNDYREACDMAVSKDIVINTLYCRTRNLAEKELPGWREIARLAGGEQYDMHIHKRAPMLLTSPDPSEFRELAANLSATYLYYGPGGYERHRMMATIDNHAMMANEMTYESRIFYKISDRYQYHQQYWDMVDYLKMANPRPEDIEMKYLPDSLRFKTPHYVLEVARNLKEKRNRVLIDLRKHLPYDRQMILNNMMEDRGLDQGPLFERVVINSLNHHAAAKGFNTVNISSIEFRR